MLRTLPMPNGTKVIRKRRPDGTYYAIKTNGKSDDGRVIAQVIKCNVGDSQYWKVFLDVNSAQLVPKQSVGNRYEWSPITPFKGYVPKKGFETLNDAFDCLNANF